MYGKFNVPKECISFIHLVKEDKDTWGKDDEGEGGLTIRYARLTGN